MPTTVATPGDSAGDDVWCMRQALALAEKARRLAPPNPWVGCLLVKEGVVVGTGYTQPPGGPHAEVLALRQAGERTHGATAYVTLEPCSHWGRTPPCSDALIAAGIARVVVAISDPDSNVSDNGLAALRHAGIAVASGLLADEAATQLESYLHHRVHGRPFVVLKAALSIDGAVAAADGTSQWITAPAARREGQRLRSLSQAVAVGAATANADRPQLTVREADFMPQRQPLRVVFDARGSALPTGPLFDPHSAASTLVFTSEEAPPQRRAAWQAGGAAVQLLPLAPQGGVVLAAALRHLAGLGVLQLMVEGGAGLLSSFLAQGCCDRLAIFHGGCLLGAARPLLAHHTIATLAQAPRFTLEECRPCGDSVFSSWRPVTP